MFKEGDLITGKDQSYERSIYKFVREINENEPEENFPNNIKPQLGENSKMKYPLTILECISFAGQVFKNKKFRTIVHESVDSFRLATQEEIDLSQSGPVGYKEREKWFASKSIFFKKVVKNDN